MHSDYVKREHKGNLDIEYYGSGELVFQFYASGEQHQMYSNLAELERMVEVLRSHMMAYQTGQSGRGD